MHTTPTPTPTPVLHSKLHHKLRQRLLQPHRRPTGMSPGQTRPLRQSCLQHSLLYHCLCVAESRATRALVRLRGPVLSETQQQFPAPTPTAAVRAFASVSMNNLRPLLRVVTHRGVRACEVGNSGSTKPPPRVQVAGKVLQRIVVTGKPSRTVVTHPTSFNLLK